MKTPYPAPPRRAFLKTIGGLTLLAPFSYLGLAGQSLSPAVDDKRLKADSRGEFWRGPLPPYAPQVPKVPFDAPSGTWTLVILPDTQNMALVSPATYLRQTEWIASHRTSHHILFVAHEGDVTHHNTPTEWLNAQRAHAVLKAAAIPYSILPGNHDYKTASTVVRDGAHDGSLLNDYFSESDYAGSPDYGLFEPGKLDNSWHEFDSPSGRVLLLSLEFAPRNAVLDWANTIVAARNTHMTMVVTHAYTDSNDRRWNPLGKPDRLALLDINGGDAMWQKFVSRHRNIHFVLSGHVLKDGAGHLVSKGAHGNEVHQIVANYQSAVWPHRAYGGGGFLRLMQFLPDRRTVRVKTYSPWFDEWLKAADQEFDLKIG